MIMIEMMINNMTADELRAVRKILDAVSTDLTLNGEDDASGQIDDVIDKIDDHLDYLEAEQEKAAEYEEQQRAGLDYPIF